jgi:hypothetical protein
MHPPPRTPMRRLSSAMRVETVIDGRIDRWRMLVH